MRFWDSSALVALHVQEKRTRLVRDLYKRDPQVLAWTLSDVELRSALCRLEREGALSQKDFEESVSRIESFWESVHVISIADAVKIRAKRLLGVHSLRAADAMQLGAALSTTYDDTRGSDFVCLDDRLALAARREGFHVLPSR